MIDRDNSGNTHNNVDEHDARRVIENESESNKTQRVGHSQFNDEVTMNSKQQIKIKDDQSFSQTSAIGIKIDKEIAESDDELVIITGRNNNPQFIKIEVENEGCMLQQTQCSRIKTGENEGIEQFKVKGEDESPLFEQTNSFRIKTDEAAENNETELHENNFRSMIKTEEQKPIKIESKFPMFDGTNSFSIKTDEAALVETDTGSKF